MLRLNLEILKLKGDDILVMTFYMTLTPIDQTIYDLATCQALAEDIEQQSLTLNTLGKTFSRRTLKYVSYCFPRKQGLTFHANCLQWR